jgi:hypothetical protein
VGAEDAAALQRLTELHASFLAVGGSELEEAAAELVRVATLAAAGIHVISSHCQLWQHCALCLFLNMQGSALEH